MKSFSSVKGEPGAPTGLTRWHRQYSEIFVMILQACSSLVLTQRVI